MPEEPNNGRSQSSSDSTPIEMFVDSAPKSRSSRLYWIIIIFLLAVLLGIFVCCGGGLWWASRNFEVSTESDTVRDRTAEMLAIDIPDDYEPKLSNRLPLFGLATVTTASYQRADDAGLHFVEMTNQTLTDANRPESLESAMGNFLSRSSKTLHVTESRIREVTVGEQVVDFRVLHGTDGSDGEEWRELHGIIETRRGLVYIEFQAPADAFEEDTCLKILSTIRLPQ